MSRLNDTSAKSIDIGAVPWEEEDIRISYRDFKDIYRLSPVKDNDGGMKAPHALMAWFIIKKLQPKLIVESGVWKGQGTWLIEQACPEAHIVCLDVDLSRLVYRSTRADYYEKDFSFIDFSGFDLSNSLCFFDDHQNSLTRIQQMYWKGFSRAIFEDNYPARRGDCYSPKKILSSSGFKDELYQKSSLRNWLRSWIKKIEGVNRNSIPPNETHRNELLSHLKCYYEAPPLYRLKKTRWGDDWDSLAYPSKPALFSVPNDDDLFSEAAAYNWLCYIELKSAMSA